jgi:alkylation response protein AidB-like acyl-CoA dehydrogenase
MDLGLTSDQELLRSTTRQFLHDTAPLSVVRSWTDLDSGYDADWWKRGANLGWTSLLVSEENGGGSVSGNGIGDLAIIAEEMGALVSPGPLSPVNIVAQTVSLDAPPEMAGEVLPGLLTGEQSAAWCLAEPGREVAAPGAVELIARSDGGDVVLSGTKSPVEAGAGAEWFLVTARSSEGMMQCLLASDAPGVEVTQLSGLDLTRRFATVQFHEVHVPSSAILHSGQRAEVAIERQLRTALILQCAETVGASSRVFEFTVEYAFDRFSFGRPLASYQALKHRFADMKMWIESAQAITSEATLSVGAESDDAGETVRIAKAYVGDRCPELIQDCIQLHGGIGVTWDHDLHLYLRRVVVHRQTYGDPTSQRDQISLWGASSECS